MVSEHQNLIPVPDESQLEAAATLAAQLQLEAARAARAEKQAANRPKPKKRTDRFGRTYTMFPPEAPPGYWCKRRPPLPHGVRDIHYWSEEEAAAEADEEAGVKPTGRRRKFWVIGRPPTPSGVRGDGYWSELEMEEGLVGMSDSDGETDYYWEEDEWEGTGGLCCRVGATFAAACSPVPATGDGAGYGGSPSDAWMLKAVAMQQIPTLASESDMPYRPAATDWHFGADRLGHRVLDVVWDHVQWLRDKHPELRFSFPEGLKQPSPVPATVPSQAGG